MSPRQTTLAIFTDLDGTLLDHETYDWSPAAPVLARLRDAGIPVVLASSKTAAEIAPLRAEMGLSACPAIVENGAGILPAGAETVPGEDYAALMQLLSGRPVAHRFRGFNEMSTEEVAATTGLSPEAAAKAKARQFSEPGLFEGSDDEREAFVQELAGEGVQARAGGRFLTLSFGRTKAQAMAEIAPSLGATLTVALGDAPNDVEMLEAADLGIIIANPAHDPLPLLPGEAEGRITRASLTGPGGWADEVGRILDENDIP
ncbi:HAD-IIB family hydrolase [Pseudoroseicyclus tamaricis]|uniref:HAD-IIB family hydrolase n=1 Tax=Pseudoroseicyclus tamaricis TaxID=2705421 RepID=A0A6B2JXR0_9RHOB|nr:HAD-IIB family hydrolase [Pseudoroseicyclus tamaricis]NDV02645.1 HAD-IIB family hydrolase [Pseudoroseicyclus tamaricis]